MADFAEQGNGILKNGIIWDNGKHGSKRIENKDGRTTDESGDYSLPENFLLWNVTVHDHDARLFEKIDEFQKTESNQLECMYVWGHAYEFQKHDPRTKGKTGTRLDDFRCMAKRIAEIGTIWCATNIEIYRYQAAAKLVTDDGRILWNRSNQSIYGYFRDKRILLKPDERFLYTQELG